MDSHKLNEKILRYSLHDPPQKYFASVKYGGGIVQMSGSLAGNIFARNRYGNYVRSKTMPVNPNTALQQAVRSAIGTLTGRWANTLTAVQRTAWELYGSSVAMKNRLGEVVFLSGLNHYIRSNAILLVNGFTVLDAGPTTFALPAQDGTLSVTISEATQLITVTFDDTMDWALTDDEYLHIYCGSPQNPTRNFFKGPWRYADSLEGDTAVPLASPLTVACSFVCTELQKIWVYARISKADGRLSEAFTVNCFCAA